MDSVAKYISENKNKQGNFLFSKVDLKYAYSQIPLHPEIRKHCNFNILGGKSTGTYACHIPKKNLGQNARKHRQQIQLSRRHTNHNKRLHPRPWTRHIQSLIQTWQGKPSHQIRKMRICQILNNLVRVQNNPVGNFPYSKKDRLHNELKTP